MGFYDDPVNVLSYLALACLVFMMPNGKRQTNSARIFVVGFVAYLVFTWPNFLRNFKFNQYLGEAYERSRTVYAYPHWDIDRVSFVLQEARVFVMVLLLSVLWHRWSLGAKEAYDITDGWSSHPFEIDRAAERAITVSEQVSRWQGYSVLLTIVFLPWTWFFWSSVTGLGDNRYIYTAILMHVMWGITWLFLSLPLLYTWQAWSNYRLRTIGSIYGRSKNETDHSLSIFREVQPISHFQLAGTSIAAIASFLWPLVQLIK